MISITFYLKVLEQHATGIMKFGIISPVDEGLLLFVLIFIISGIFGDQIWYIDVGFNVKIV